MKKAFRSGLLCFLGGAVLSMSPIVSPGQAVDDLLPDDVLVDKLPPLPPPPGNPPTGEGDSAAGADQTERPRKPYHYETHQREVGSRILAEELRGLLLRDDLLGYADELLRPQFTGEYGEGELVPESELPGGVPLMDRFRLHATAGPPTAAGLATNGFVSSDQAGADPALESIRPGNDELASLPPPPVRASERLTNPRAVERSPSPVADVAPSPPPAPRSSPEISIEKRSSLSLPVAIGGSLTLFALLFLAFRRLAGFGAGRF